MNREKKMKKRKKKEKEKKSKKNKIKKVCFCLGIMGLVMSRVFGVNFHGE